MKPVNFKDIKINSAFTPVPGSIGASQVFVKKQNGICPIVSRENKRDNTIEFGRYELESIFHPYDKVYASALPQKVLNFYQ